MSKTLLNTLAITALALAGSMDAAKAGQPTPTPSPTPKQYIQGGTGAFATNERAVSKPTPTPKANAKAIVKPKSTISTNKHAATPTPTPKKKATTGSSFDAGGNAMKH